MRANNRRFVRSKACKIAEIVDSGKYRNEIEGMWISRSWRFSPTWIDAT
jgi:hypothetical protein